MAKENILNIKSLKEQVYEYLRQQIHSHQLSPGSVINMDAFCKKLGISKTPLRDALIQLEMEGFVIIEPRKGIYVNKLTIEDVKEFYQVIGALESSALSIGLKNISQADITKMGKLNQAMRKAIASNNFDLFYENNLKFHNIYINSCGNTTLFNIINNLKKRLYDFPRQEKWIKEWELDSIEGHQQLIGLINDGKAKEASEFLHNHVWSFKVHEKFILRYYF